eukprot:TRINITY_DN3305_c0_g1_i2.p1 TRINITY_DN3305_c0_g1~~TRINITY_DN3305_c0_g1_i2.p1  ORF type:complete len:159 (-),score=25.33 TRINITY_DN3305_c0_g1_i2:367-843(-)
MIIHFSILSFEIVSNKSCIDFKEFAERYPFLTVKPEEANNRKLVLYPPQIWKNIFLGGELFAKSQIVLENLQIKYILNVAAELPNHFSSDGRFVYEKYHLYDTCDLSNEIVDYLDKGADFLHRAVEANQNVYVHCAMGASRSPTIIASYLIKYHNIGC